MFQIISGKFFSNERYQADTKGIIFSNYRLSNTIDINFGKLDPATSFDNISSYVFSYNGGLEKDPSSKGFALIRVGEKEVIDQLKLLCFFGFRAFFDTEKREIEEQCKGSGNFLPSTFLKRFFDQQIIGTKEETDFFLELCKKIIGLPRDTYKTVMKCLDRLYESVSTVKYDVDSAYSMLIYSLETLAQTFDQYEPIWEDFDQDIRGKLEKFFGEIEAEKANRIKEILLNSKHLKLQKRFITFVTKHIGDSFYTTDAEEIGGAIKRSELEEALKTAYSIRSGYVHQLIPIMKQLKLPLNIEVFIWEHQPYLTYNGLFRLTYTVIMEFIYKQKIVEKETYNWQDDLPGSVQFKLHPMYWVHNASVFTESQSVRYFEGFLEIVDETVRERSNEIINLTELLERIEKLLPEAKKENKISMFALYTLYNELLPEELRTPNYNTVFEKYRDLMDLCTIEMMTVKLLSGKDWNWEIETCVEVYNKYKKRSFKPNALKIPDLFEIMILIYIANCYLDAGNTKLFKDFLERALYDLSGQKEAQELVKKHIETNTKVNLDEIVNIGVGNLFEKDEII